MQLPHNALVVVADGRKSLFFRNEGDAEFPNLIVEQRLDAPRNPDDHDSATDLAGRMQSTRADGQGWSADGNVDNTDFHQQAEDRFAAETAQLLKERALRHEFEALIVVAPPKTLGELRKHYHSEVSSRIAGEIDKALVGHTVPQIEEALSKA
ncbi:host attachment family protein [Sphingomonas sp.]|uniref:host attachment family protein n=1 Tax=Sphingomonas sp. TaxID=28214 RepID=UPI001B297045|nr:host attachment family protein [Sphingomonas sp.]MBO9712231.1 host attachment protein [Sphingomonas sp.]